MAEQDVKLTIKIVLVGVCGAGKSMLLARIARDEWSERTQYISTVGVDFGVCSVLLAGTGMMGRLHVWDTSGQTKFHTLTVGYYKHADAIFFCFDPSQPDTLDACLSDYYVQKWVDTASKNVFVALVGCKWDTAKPCEQLLRKIEGTGLPIFWTSARENTGVAELVQAVGEHVVRARRKELQEERFMESAYLVPKPTFQQQRRTTCECLIL
jgi:small GTP-binding protein